MTRVKENLYRDKKTIENLKKGQQKKNTKDMTNEEFTTHIRKCGTGAHILITKAWLGKRVKVSIKEDEN